MKIIKIENKAAKVSLDDQVDEYSRKQLMQEIAKTYGSSAFNDDQFSALTACVENEIDTLELYVNSPGGSVFDGYVIHNELLALRARGVHVTAKVQLAASMASVISMAADDIQMLPNGRMMIHDASIAIRGNAKQLTKAAAMVDGISAEIAAIYSERTGKPAEEMRALMREETWMDAKQCVALGFANGIFDIRASSDTIPNMSLLDRLTNPSSAESIEKIQALENVIANHDADIAEFKAKLETAENALQEAAGFKAEVETLTGKLEAAESTLLEFTAKITTLEGEVITAKASAAQSAVEIAAAAGIEAPLNIEGGGNSGASATMSRKDFAALKPSAAMKFTLNGGKLTD
jgi:ATP-dependent protease ClpP protease subunit